MAPESMRPPMEHPPENTERGDESGTFKIDPNDKGEITPDMILPPPMPKPNPEVRLQDVPKFGPKGEKIGGDLGAMEFQAGEAARAAEKRAKFVADLNKDRAGKENVRMEKVMKDLNRDLLTPATPGGFKDEGLAAMSADLEEKKDPTVSVADEDVLSVEDADAHNRETTPPPSSERRDTLPAPPRENYGETARKTIPAPPSEPDLDESKWGLGNLMSRIFGKKDRMVDPKPPEEEHKQ